MLDFYYGHTSLEIMLLFGAVLVSLFASWQVNSVYKKYSHAVGASYTGAEIARYILEKNNLHNVQVKIGSASSELSNFYDPQSKTVTLSEVVYYSNSISAIAIAAHEVGHAIQHAKNYAGISVRNTVLPAALVSSKLFTVLILVSFIFDSPSLFGIGIVLYGIVLLFQIVTLPVEFDASKRALENLETYALVDGSAKQGAKKVLSAAAFTYVAAVLSSLATIIRLILINSGRRR